MNLIFYGCNWGTNLVSPNVLKFPQLLKTAAE